MQRRTTAETQSSGNGHVPSGPWLAAAIPLPPKLLRHLAKSLKKQWRRYRQELKHCQQDFSEEAVHESRVASRRLLSTIELLAGFLPPARIKKIRRALKQYRDSFDALRDTHVQLAAVSRLRRAFPGARAFYAFLRAREEGFARQTRQCIRRIRHRQLGKWIRACRKDCLRQQKVVGPAAAAVLVLRSIHQAFDCTCTCYAQIDPQQTHTIHRTRVAFKKFRYMVEELAELLPGMGPRHLAAMHRYQTQMGAIQDAEVLLGVLDQFLRSEAPETGPARALSKKLQQRRQNLVRQYLAGADRLLTFWPGPAAAAAGLRSPAQGLRPAPGRHSHSLEPARDPSRPKAKRKTR